MNLFIELQNWIQSTDDIEFETYIPSDTDAMEVAELVNMSLYSQSTDSLSFEVILVKNVLLVRKILGRNDLSWIPSIKIKTSPCKTKNLLH
jgi:hypothetical protein